MKNSSLRKTSLRLLVIAGALTPLATLGANSMVAAYGEGGMYENLSHIQSSQDTTENLRGAQGPVRTDFSDPLWSYDEGAFYDNLKNTQETSQPMDTMSGS